MFVVTTWAKVIASLLVIGNIISFIVAVVSYSSGYGIFNDSKSSSESQIITVKKGVLAFSVILLVIMIVLLFFIMVAAVMLFIGITRRRAVYLIPFMTIQAIELALITFGAVMHVRQQSPSVSIIGLCIAYALSGFMFLVV